MRKQPLASSTQTKFLPYVAWLTAALLVSEAKAEPESEIQDDILEIVDLPLAADLAKNAGLSEKEVQETIKVAQDGGMGASTLSGIFVGEADAVRTRGKKKGLPVWVMERWAAGDNGKAMKASLGSRPEKADLEPAKKEELKKKLKSLKKKRQEENKKRHAEVKAQRKAGKALKLRGKSAHARLEQGLKANGKRRAPNPPGAANDQFAPGQQKGDKKEHPHKDAQGVESAKAGQGKGKGKGKQQDNKPAHGKAGKADKQARKDSSKGRAKPGKPGKSAKPAKSAKSRKKGKGPKR